jgi:hypothetical protein
MNPKIVENALARALGYLLGDLNKGIIVYIDNEQYLVFINSEGYLMMTKSNYDAEDGTRISLSNSEEDCIVDSSLDPNSLGILHERKVINKYDNPEEKFNPDEKD